MVQREVVMVIMSDQMFVPFGELVIKVKLSTTEFPQILNCSPRPKKTATPPPLAPKKTFKSLTKDNKQLIGGWSPLDFEVHTRWWVYGCCAWSQMV